MTATELFRVIEIRTGQSKENKLKRQGGRCFWCKEPVAWDPEEVRKTQGQVCNEGPYLLPK